MNKEEKLLPIFGRIKHVGGIDSIVIDEVRYYFGLNYKTDSILSNPIDNKYQMAEFASQSMIQMDGAHNKKFWLELIVDADSISELSDANEFKSEYFKSISTSIEKAIKENIPDATFGIEYHLLYLISIILAKDFFPIRLDADIKKKMDNLSIVEIGDWIGNVGDLVSYVNGNSQSDDLNCIQSAAICLKYNLEHAVEGLPFYWKNIFYKMLE